MHRGRAPQAQPSPSTGRTHCHQQHSQRHHSRANGEPVSRRSKRSSRQENSTRTSHLRKYGSFRPGVGPVIRAAVGVNSIISMPKHSPYSARHASQRLRHSARSLGVDKHTPHPARRNHHCKRTCTSRRRHRSDLLANAPDAARQKRNAARRRPTARSSPPVHGININAPSAQSAQAPL